MSSYDYKNESKMQMGILAVVVIIAVIIVIIALYYTWLSLNSNSTDCSENENTCKVNDGYILINDDFMIPGNVRNGTLIEITGTRLYNITISPRFKTGILLNFWNNSTLDQKITIGTTTCKVQSIRVGEFIQLINNGSIWICFSSTYSSNNPSVGYMVGKKNKLYPIICSINLHNKINTAYLVNPGYSIEIYSDKCCMTRIAEYNNYTGINPQMFMVKCGYGVQKYLKVFRRGVEVKYENMSGCNEHENYSSDSDSECEKESECGSVKECEKKSECVKKPLIYPYKSGNFSSLSEKIDGLLKDE
jgi:hypothetical protein